ncbi:hypothetical protein [Nitrospina gracilis]|nr:hypothetical protein [Nitrospina gracilis]
MTEFPIHFEDRRAGQSKISKREILKAMLNLLRVAFRRCFVLPWSGKYRQIVNPLAAAECKHCQSLHSMELARNDTLTRRKCLHCGYQFDQKLEAA